MRLLGLLLQIGRDERLARVMADIQPENLEMQRVCARLGFRLHRDLTDSMVRAEKLL